jgi:PAS domain S-box-containing protein
MTTPLRLLLVEDSEDDAALIVRELERGGYRVEARRIESQAALTAALQDARAWDLVICDYALPRFDAPRALGLVRERGLDIPFIIVSGVVDEATAVDAMRAGAQDFIVKGRLARLVPAVARELSEAGARRARRAAEQALHTSEMRFRRLAESGIIGIAITDAAGGVLEANDAFLGTLGYSTADLRAGRIRSTAMLGPASEGEVDSARSRLSADGVAHPFETEYVRDDGRRVPLLVAAASLEGAKVISVCLDLSERKRLEEQLRQAQKMEAIGTLAGGVAHDFNNLLSVILSYASLLAERLPEGDPLRSDLEEIRKAGERASDLTRQLLTFSRRAMQKPRPVDPNRVLEGVQNMLRRLLGEDIELSIVTAPDAGTVQADPGQLEQVIMNLVVNARDAMPKGGRLRIETARAVIGDAAAPPRVGATPGRYVSLAISDNGVGMDEPTLARIFEPFFTTKGPGRGTGLGLPTVYGIAQQSGGWITVRSEPNRGSTFCVYLPATDDAAETLPVPEPPVATLRGVETILVVEDEPQVRTTLRAVLAHFGYDVLEAQNAGEAILVCEQHAAPIHLLVTDVVLPKMSGRDLAVRLARARTEMRVLYISGYSERAAAHHDALDRGAFFEKPITPDAFARRVREVLDAPRQGRGNG